MGSRRSIAWLVAATFLSAIVSDAVGALFGEPLFTGFFFGISLAAYFAVYERWENAPDLVWLTAACTVAYPVAHISSALTGLIALGPSMGGSKLSPAIFLVGGFTGALILGTAFIWRFAPAERQSIVTLVVLGMGGGILGVIGGAVSESRFFQIHEDILPLYLIWQPGMGALLAWALGPLPSKLPQSAKSSFPQG